MQVCNIVWQVMDWKEVDELDESSDSDDRGSNSDDCDDKIYVRFL